MCGLRGRAACLLPARGRRDVHRQRALIGQIRAVACADQIALFGEERRLQDAGVGADVEVRRGYSSSDAESP